MRKFQIFLFLFLILMSGISLQNISCSSRQAYIPPTDVEMRTGHFILFFNEMAAADTLDKQPVSLLINIFQEGKSIIKAEIEAGKYVLYPIEEGVYSVNLKIDFRGQSITRKRTFTSKVGNIDGLSIEFQPVESATLKRAVQLKRTFFTGKTVSYILDSIRAEKPLKFEELLRMKNRGSG
ncbi:MAG TPA: hypothetical protein DHW42_01290 [Candidatus Marinimicrobia bacterium]|nr:hypothetical protein [Candidatus Neomarinimicrobiota bacterium]